MNLNNDQKKCLNCENVFEKKLNKKYCSLKCQKEFLREKEKIQHEVQCPMCLNKRIVNRPIYIGNTHCNKCKIILAKNNTTTAKGKESHSWKGGKRVDTHGYIKIHKPGHYFADSTNYVREHLLVVSDYYGIEYITNNGGCVHHIDGNKQNNQIKNLYVCTRKRNAEFNQELLKMAFELVQSGHIIFNSEFGKYSCPLLSDKEDEPTQIR